MKSQYRFMSAAIAAFMFAVFALGVSAQEYRGTISGTVTDPNGAVIPGAKVTVKNIGTNIAVNTVTNESGSYTVPFLVPGTYSVSVVGDGFKATARGIVEGLVVDLMTLDFVVELGPAAEAHSG